MASTIEIINKIKDEIDVNIEQSDDGLAIIYVAKENVIKLLKILKEKFEFKMLADLTALDYEDRFEVVYHLMSFNEDIIKIKVKLPKESSKIPTATLIWKAANVQEREIFDMFGIQFEGHDNLTRILLPDEFEGYPLRKDFKLETVDRF